MLKILFCKSVKGKGKMRKELSRREFLKVSGLAAGAASFAGCGLSAARRGRGGKPNIIFIMADDLGYGDLGCYGQKKIKTANLDRMAREGMRFSQHYSGSTVCAPSRCSLMTGKHTGHCYIRGNDRLPLRKEDVTVAEVLKEAGYATGITGKWGLGEPGTSGIPNRKGFDEWLGFLNQRNAHSYYPEYLWQNEKKVMLEGNAGGKREEYCHDMFSEFAVDFIRRHKDEPFFLYFASTIPHVELAVPEDSIAAYRGKFPEKPFKGSSDHYCSQATPHAAYAGMVSRLDGDVGKILDEIKKCGIEEDTIVIFTSDNGPEKKAGADPRFFDSNGPMKGVKRDLYEGGIRVPLIVRWKGQVQQGSQCGHACAFWDFMPTFAELGDGKCPDGIDGLSIVPSLMGDAAEQKKHEFLYWEFHEQGKKQAVRMGDWKGVRTNVYKRPNANWELYDLADDIGERHNIAGKHPQVVERIKNYVAECRTVSEKWPLTKEEKSGK